MRLHLLSQTTKKLLDKHQLEESFLTLLNYCINSHFYCNFYNEIIIINSKKSVI